jgi:hypothetical protein
MVRMVAEVRKMINTHLFCLTSRLAAMCCASVYVIAHIQSGARLGDRSGAGARE